MKPRHFVSIALLLPLSACAMPAGLSGLSSSENPAPMPEEKVRESGPILTGRITDSRGLGVAGVKIVLFDGLAERIPVAEAVTDAKGDYRFDPCTHGWWVERTDEPGFFDQMVGLQLVHPGLVSKDGCWWWDRIVKAGDKKRTRHDIAVVPAGTLAGTVVEEGTRTPVPSLSLQLVGVGENPYLRPLTTGEDGQFVADGLFPGNYEVEIVTPEGYRRPIGRARVTARQTSEIWLGLPSAPITASADLGKPETD